LTGWLKDVLSLLVALSLAAASEPSQEPPEEPTGETPAPSVEPYAQAMKEGDLAFAGRDDAERLTVAVARYEEALRLRPGDESALIALCRAEAFAARATPGEALPAWQRTARFAEQALRISAPTFASSVDRGEDPVLASARVDARAAEPLYWFALATLGLGQARGMAATLAVKDVARGLMERAAALDERVDHGGPCRALGALLATLPSAAGGGAQAAGREFSRATALFPSYELTRVIEAQTLAVLLQDRARFEALLHEVLSFDETRAPEVAPENRLAKRLAKELLAREDRLF